MLEWELAQAMHGHDVFFHANKRTEDPSYGDGRTHLKTAILNYWINSTHLGEYGRGKMDGFSFLRVDGENSIVDLRIEGHRFGVVKHAQQMRLDRVAVGGLTQNLQQRRI